MAGHGDEHERTMAFADIALSQIRALRQPASPRNYEIWYTYATGFNPALNKSINDALAQKGSLTVADLDRFYDAFLSQGRVSESIDTVGARVVDEIEQIMAMIEAASGTATSYSASLTNATQELGAVKDREGLRAIVESLVITTREIEKSNQALEARLKASKQEISHLQENLEAVRTESLTDPLTSLANRKYFDQVLARAMADATARGDGLSLMLTDIDHFKKFNDLFGHLTGDQVLRLVAQTVKQNVKGQDTAARYGGEEFAVVLPGTALRQAITVAENVRRAVMTKELMKRSTGEHLGRITVSIGVALYRGGENAQSFIERADSCLYAAKRNGRNRVICETDPEIAATISAVA